MAKGFFHMISFSRLAVAQRRQSDPTSHHTIETLGQAKSISINFPWWLHPLWIVAFLCVLPSLIAATLPPDVFSIWRAPKFLENDALGLLAIMIASLVLGILTTSATALKKAPARLHVTKQQVNLLQSATRTTFVLAVIGYLAWFVSATTQGASFDQILDVLNRQGGAISDLKENARPIAGITTFTQFGPFAAAGSVLLARLGVKSRLHWILLALAATRTLFYAERLALIEVLVPALVILAVTTEPRTARSNLIRAAPILATPLAWAIFAASEWTRSWVYYQQVVSQTFGEWVSLRLVGYYITSLNNSALYNSVWDSTWLPYYTFEGFWNAPLISNLIDHPGAWGTEVPQWWTSTLQGNSNPEFNNTGSFLMASAELGPIGASLFWLVLGLVVGLVFAKASQGNLPSLIGFAVLLIGLIELPRFLYWTQGRAFPIIFAALVFAYFAARQRARDLKAAQAPLGGRRRLLAPR